MSVSDEDKLLASLIWSSKTFSLAEFVETYELPQVVCVKVGYFGDSEETTLSRGQVLTLHSLQSTSKFVCESPFNGIITIPQNCPLKFRIHPWDCEHTSVTAKQLATRYRHIEYIQVVHLSHPDVKESSNIDILKIKHFDSAKSLIKCSDVSTGSDVSIAFKGDALFSPLLNQREYTLAEVKLCFGFPAKVCLSEKKTEGKSRSRNDSSMLVSNLREIKVNSEIEDYVVISTTMCGTTDSKTTCLYIPKNLEIQVVVAEGFISGDAAYQRIVRTLNKRLNRTCLKDFQDMDVYEHLDAVKKAAGVSTFSVEHASAKVEPLAMEHRSNQFSGVPSPTFPSPVQYSTWQPRALPKIPPKPPAKVLQTFRSKSLSPTSIKASDFLHSPTKNRTKNDGDSEYVEATSVLPAGYINKTTGDDYAELDANYQPVDNIYNLLIKPDHPVKPVSPCSPRPQGPIGSDSEVGKDYESVDNICHRPVEPDYPVKPDLPSSPPPSGCCMGKEEIYQAIARIPQDLSSLTTGDVGRLLTYLGMECHVSKFDHEMVDGVMLADINQESLESLDLGAFHIKKLLKFIRGWRPNV